ncbi:MAG TPA: hypothetical protein VNT55_20110 [Baekduia sp.]|nr:hypothetical protein [Baekduia sp.]
MKPMTVVRVWIPVAILVAGVVIVIVRGGDETSLEGAAALWGAGLSVALLNWLHRMGVSGDSARTREDEARAYFARHGRWPDEAETPHRYVPPRQGS